MSRMKRGLKVALIFYAVMSLVAALLVIDFFNDVRDKGAFIENYGKYSPRVCFNTKWTCAERDIYFYSDAEGMTRGVVNIDKGPKYFNITFRTDTNDGASGYVIISQINALTYEKNLGIMISAKIDFYEDRCVMTYCEDEKNFWGPCEEEVTLTFWKEELGEPFRYAN